MSLRLVVSGLTTSGSFPNQLPFKDDVESKILLISPLKKTKTRVGSKDIVLLYYGNFPDTQGSILTL